MEGNHQLAVFIHKVEHKVAEGLTAVLLGLAWLW